jgi:LysR family transcriptional regulator, carnitine catabolism transcriptional activator
MAETPLRPPRSQQPTLRQLRAFDAVARHRSFRRAADELALSQPALSAAVRDFETLLGATLLERSTHRVALTEAGAGVLPSVQWLLNSFALGVDDLHHALAQQARRLRLAALPSAMHQLAPALADWQAQHREVELVLRDLLQEELVAALHAGELDLALGAGVDLPDAIVASPVGCDELVAVLPADHRLAARTSLRWADLRGERLALFARGSTYDFALAPLRQHGADLQHASRLAYSESLFSLVRSGLAVGVVFALYTHSLRGDHGLVVRPLRAPAVERRLVLMAHRHALALSPVVASCQRHLMAVLAAPVKATRARSLQPSTRRRG